MKLFFFIFFSLLFLACNNHEKQKAANDNGIRLEDVKLISLSGDSISMNSFKNKTLFINFWATWCKPCIEEMPSIQAMMEKMNSENIEFLFASEESPEQIQAFAAKTGYNFSFVQVSNPDVLQIMTLPTTFIFSKSGRLVYNEMGFQKWDNKKNIDLIKEIISEL